MTRREKLANCRGCRDNFYNGNNEIGVSECWAFAGARLVRKVRVAIDERPPWLGPVVKVFDCRRERGFVLITPEARDANTSACARADRVRERCVPQEGGTA